MVKVGFFALLACFSLGAHALELRKVCAALLKGRPKVELSALLSRYGTLSPSEAGILEGKAGEKYFLIWRGVVYSLRRSKALQAKSQEISWVIRKLGTLQEVSGAIGWAETAFHRARQRGQTGLLSYAAAFDPLSIWTEFGGSVKARVVSELPYSDRISAVSLRDIALALPRGG